MYAILYCAICYATLYCVCLLISSYLMIPMLAWTVGSLSSYLLIIPKNYVAWREGVDDVLSLLFF
ncbi:hypothetical protein BO70DRAFT_26475 [Aspergillus heteromorphus CBS 117.55]|uniref:Uncharacterized protein n=1 Tax=Aspergillus heteromorphus CBS 117.55 TaxID=1448321 RepID=A0A317WGY2_9EURO|nr:uncharacterized protein BO70DRAFT_26475 [Aspergillus heteromorphus CBS 117.55]PWY83460.1 hypothetical protein BO70DRAFT_26475 [Aspergillus heteromorphus CBS 117.55]